MVDRRFRWFAPLLLLLLGTAARPAGAENAPREHDRGFFLRLSGGFGTGAIKSNVGNTSEGDVFPPGTDVEMSGEGGNGDLAIGALVSPNLAVHGTAWGWSAFDPDLKAGGRKLSSTDLTLSMTGFGPGLTWYFGQNFYLTGSVGVAKLTAKADRVSIDSNTGVAADFAIGKEWWIGQRWGFGVALNAGAHSIPTDDPDLDDKFTGGNFGVRVSATLN